MKLKLILALVAATAVTTGLARGWRCRLLGCRTIQESRDGRY